MDRLSERLAVARKALDSLSEILLEPRSVVVRDASIQRFEYTFEALWKAAQMFLRTAESLDAASPKSAIRSSFRVRLLGEAQADLALSMADDRNLTAHTYNESLAERIYAKLPDYARVMDEWLSAMEARVQGI